MTDYKLACVDKINEVMNYSNEARTYFREDELEEIADTLANDLGYFTYGDSCVIDVKGRPYLSFTLEDLNEKANTTIVEQQFMDTLDTTIEAFAKELEQKYPNFIIVGRSGGYWGLDSYFGYIEISPKGRAELAKQLEDKYTEYINEQNYTQEMLEDSQRLEDDINYLYDYYIEDIFDALLEDPYNFKINENYVLSLEELSKDIDAEEEKVSNIDYWLNLFNK